jgi:cardiolipin synthase
MKKRGETRYVRLPYAGVAAMVFVIASLAVLFWSAKWRRDPELQVKQDGQLVALLPSVVGLTQGSLEEGNRIEVLQNGAELFPRLMSEIAAARQSVHIETFIWWDGKLARDLSALLARKAEEGVEVRLLVDGSGGRQIREVQERLEKAGVKVARFHPIRISNLARLNNRDHRKIVVIDGRIGYTGGFGIGDEWTGNATDKKHWRDTAVRIEGPVVHRLQAAFAENWIEETGEVPAGERYFPHLPPAGATPAHVAFTSPAGSVSSVQILYYLAIKAARREIIIQNPYLLPERNAIAALEDAVRRGVKVMVMVPSVSATDSAIVQHASHHRYGNLLQRGVRIWEYEKTLLHQKIVIVDGVWSCVGSTNFDARSLEVNDEVSIGIVDREIAAQLRAAFFADMKFARERKLEEWQNRPLWHKMQDGIAYLANEQL